MTLGDFRLSVRLLRETAGLQFAGPRAQAHRAAQFVDAFQLAQFVDDAMRRAGIELAGVGVFQAADVAGVFDHRALHPQANAEVWNLPRARVLDRVDHAGNAALAESAGHQDAVAVFELALPAGAVRSEKRRVGKESR